MRKFPPDEDLESMRRKLAKAPATRLIPDDAPLRDQIKKSICAQLIKYKREQGINQRELAQKLEISEALVSQLLRYHFDRFTIDRLVGYLEKLGIDFSFGNAA